MNSDFKDLLRLFAKHDVQFLVVGGYAVMRYSQPRFTKDLDLWLNPNAENADRVLRAFAEFGIPLVDVTADDFARHSFQYMVGRAPVLFDFLTSLPGMSFEDCWANRYVDSSEGFPIPYLGREDLVEAKKKAARPQDLADLDDLQRAGSGSSSNGD